LGTPRSQNRDRGHPLDFMCGQGWAIDVGAGEAGFDDGGDAAAGAEVAFDDGPDGVGGLDEVFEDLVDDVFLEDAEVAVAEEVFLEALELGAAVAGHIADGECAEVGEAGFGADGGEFGVVDEDFVAGKLVWPGFNGGEGEVESGRGVLVGVAFFSCHGIIVARGGKGRKLVAGLVWGIEAGGG